MSDGTSLSDGRRCIFMGERRNSDVYPTIFLIGGAITAAIGIVHDVVGIPTLNGIIGKSDNEFSTTSFVGSPTKSSQNYDNRPSEISPECTSAKISLRQISSTHVPFMCSTF